MGVWQIKQKIIARGHTQRVAFAPLLILTIGVLVTLGVSTQRDSSAAVETARPADSLVDTMGMALHLRYWNQDVFNNIFKPRLCEVGIRRVRDGGGHRDTTFTGNLNTLARECGIKSTLVMDPRDGNLGTDGPAMILAAVDSVEIVEGPNEWDNNRGASYGGATWPGSVRNYMNELYDSIKNHSDPRVRAVRVGTPSMANPSAGNEVGPVPCDIGVMHSYSGSPNLPDDQLETKWLPPTRAMCPNDKPVIASEAGYCNQTESNGCTGQGGVSRRTLAKYVLRHYLEYYMRGIERDHFYNLSLDVWSAFLESNGVPKPAFYSVKNFISLLEDPGASFTPGALDYTITGNTTNLKKQLFQKRDGTFYLAVWLNVNSTTGGFNNHTDKDTAQAISINFGQSVTAMRAFYPTFDGAVVKESYSNTASISTTARDQVVIYEITPPPPGDPQPPLPSGQSDLVVTSIAMSPASPVAGDQVVLSATIKNQGTGASPANTVHGVSFRVDGMAVTWSDTSTSSIPAGGSITLSANNGPNGVKHWLATTGTHTVEAVVDDINRIPNELSETNNATTVPLVVGNAILATAGDANSDNKVNAIDLSILLSRDGQVYPAADFNKDGTVGAADMAILLSKWTW